MTLALPRSPRYSAAVDFDRDLNPPQREAALHTKGPLLVLAGAGSGKTRVITYRIAHLIESGTPAHGILAVTFTNKAAGEMRERAEKVLGHSASGLWIGTFHSICARLLRQHGEAVGLSRRFVIYDDDDQTTLVRRVLADLGAPERLFAPREVLHRIDRAKNAGIGPADYVGEDFVTDMVAKVYPEYERRLLAADAVDFGNLILKVVELLHRDPVLAERLSSRFEQVLVDEFQDTNAVQYELVRLLSARHGNLCVVGDDDQSIYGWRGANIENILGFEKDHPSAVVIKLEQNYRSTQVILDAAGAVISANVGRKPKKLWTDRAGGEPIALFECEDERAESGLVLTKLLQLRDAGRRFGDVAVFYRTHAQSRVIEEAFRGARPKPIPYAVVGGVRFYDRAEIKDLLAYLKLLCNPADEVSFIRIVNVPTRGIGQSTIERVSEVAKRDRIPLLAAARRCASGEGGAPRPAPEERGEERGPQQVSLIPSEEDGLRTGPRRKLAAFCDLMEELAEEQKTVSPSRLAETVLERSGYLERLAIDGSPEAQGRIENLMELVTSLRDYEEDAEDPSLAGFLEQVTLASDLDGYAESEGKVTLMTVHSAKGLEFPAVFIIGLEQGVFPHSRSLGEPDQMEEERRLAYVAITRARELLFLSYARQRFVFGLQQANEPSEFLREIPEHLLAAKGQRFRNVHTALGGRGRAPLPWERRARELEASGASARDREGDKPAGREEGSEVWVDRSFDQSSPLDWDDPVSGPGGFQIGMKVQHKKFGVGTVRVITGAPPNLNLTIYFASVGPRTIRSQFVQPA
jgi:DNA helicase-2/ATP-dependent DNA helicase PcrA